MNDVLRPFSTSELLDRTLTCYLRKFGLVFAIEAVSALILFVVQLRLVLASGRTVRGHFIHVSARLCDGLLFSMLVLPVTIIFLLVSAASQGATISAVSAMYMGRQTTIAESFAAMKGKIARTAGVWFVTGLLVGLGFMLFVVPGILLALRWALVLPCTVLEETGVAESRARSTTLTEGCRGRIFLIVFLYLVLFYLLTVLAVMPLAIGLGIEAARTHSQQ